MFGDLEGSLHEVNDSEKQINKNPDHFSTAGDESRSFEPPWNGSKLTFQQWLLGSIGVIVLVIAGVWLLAAAVFTRQSAPVLVEIGALYQATGRSQDAVRILDEAIRAGINDPAMLGRVGELYRLVREYDKSIDILKSALNSDPLNEPYLLSLARSYAGANRCEEAYQEFQKLILLRPDNFTYSSGIVACFRINGEYESALTELNRYLQVMTTDYQAYQLRGDIYRDQQKWEESIAEYQKAVEMNPEAYTSYINMGLSYTNQRAYNVARINFQEVSRIFPNRPEPYYYSAETYIGEGKFEAAIPFYEKALEVDDTYALAHMGLGKAYAAMDNCAAAIPYFQEALIFSPENIDATQGLTNCSVLP